MTVTAEVTLPDGRVAEVSGPTREAVLLRVNALRAIEEPPKPEGSTLGGITEAAGAVLSSAVAEPIAGLTGLVNAPVAGADNASEIIDDTREALTFEPRTQAGDQALEKVGQFGEFVTNAARVPVSGLVGLASLPQGVDKAAENVRRVQDEGVGPFFGDKTLEATGSPELATAVETTPAAFLSAVGVKGVNRFGSNRLRGINREVQGSLQARGLDPSDTSPQNIERMKAALAEEAAQQTDRAQTFRELGIEPTRAQVTRKADDFQQQQEVRKRSGPVRDRLETQEAQLSDTFDDAIEGTEGLPVSSGSSVVDEVTSRFTRLDQEINRLYKQARDTAGDGEIVDPKLLVERLEKTVPSDRAMKGLPGSIRGNLRQRGIIDGDGNILRKLSVKEAEEVRIFINDHFDSTSAQGRRSIRSLKDSLDNDVFRDSGGDLFNEARTAKADFENQLSAAKLNKFDQNRRNVVRDILENRIDPEDLANRITSTKSFRAQDLRQLRDFLEQTDSGIAAFDDLRAQTLQNIKDKAFFGPEDANGIRAISRDRLEKSLNQIGPERMEILFTAEERRLLNRIVKVTKLREPVRGTAVGKGPSAQGIEALREQLSKADLIGRFIDNIFVGRDGKIVLQGNVNTPVIGRRLTPASGVAVPLAVGQGNEN